METVPTVVIYRRNIRQWLVLGMPVVILAAGGYVVAREAYGFWAYAAVIGGAALWLALFWLVPKLSVDRQVQVLQLTGDRLQGRLLNYFGDGPAFEVGLDEATDWTWHDTHPLVALVALFSSSPYSAGHVLFSAHGVHYRVPITLLDQVDLEQLHRVGGLPIANLLASNPRLIKRIGKPL